MSFRGPRLAILLTPVVGTIFLILMVADIQGRLRGEQELSPTVMPIQVTIPPVLGGLPLVETVTGDEGLAQVSQLHGKDIDLARGFLAQYAGNGAGATMWVGWAESKAAAQALTDRMTAKIGADHPIFQNFQVLTMGGRTLYVATGQGQHPQEADTLQHYYFRSGAAVVWVAVDSTAAQEVVHDALKRFP